MLNVGFKSIDTSPGSTGKLTSVNDCGPLLHTFAGPPTGGRSQGIVNALETCGDTDVVVFDQSASPLFLTTSPTNASRLNVAVISPCST